MLENEYGDFKVWPFIVSLLIYLVGIVGLFLVCSTYSMQIDFSLLPTASVTASQEALPLMDKIMSYSSAFWIVYLLLVPGFVTLLLRKQSRFFGNLGVFVWLIAILVAMLLFAENRSLKGMNALMSSVKVNDRIGTITLWYAYLIVVTVPFVHCSLNNILKGPWKSVCDEWFYFKGRVGNFILLCIVNILSLIIAIVFAAISGVIMFNPKLIFKTYNVQIACAWGIIVCVTFFIVMVVKLFKKNRY